MNVPNALVELIERFERNREAYFAAPYNETQVRIQFLDPLFTLLGWDVENKAGYSELYKDVVHEDAVKIGGASKAPDYTFRIGGGPQVLCRGQAPSSRDLKNDVSAAYQLRRYGWSSKLPRAHP